MTRSEKLAIIRSTIYECSINIAAIINAKRDDTFDIGMVAEQLLSALEDGIVK